MLIRSENSNKLCIPENLKLNFLFLQNFENDDIFDIRFSRIDITCLFANER